MLRIGREHAASIIGHAIRESPNECCGILAGNDHEAARVYAVTNSVKSPYRYLMDPQEQLNVMLDAERNGWALLAFYHSHTHSPAYPSETDVRMALQSGWLDVYYVLVSLEDREDPDIRAFHVGEDGSIVEEELKIA